MKPDEHEQLQDPRQMALWARRYAENRTLPVILSLLLFLAFSLAIGGGSCLVGWAYLKGKTVLLGVSIAFLIPVLVALVWFSVPGLGGKWMERVTGRLYASEGHVAISCPGAGGRKQFAWVLSIGFGACIAASVVLGMLGYIPQRYMQPVSAMYVVPFMFVLGLAMRPAGGPLMFLWPALYAVHAILIVAGAPIVFSGPWDGMNMLIPTVGYGLLAASLSHLYSRVALRRLRRLAQMELPRVEEA